MLKFEELNQKVLDQKNITNILKNQINIGIFGGSFDPFHYGHLMIANWAIEKLNIDSLIFLVARTNEFKPQYKKSVSERCTQIFSYFENLSKKIHTKKIDAKKIFISSIEEDIKSSCTYDTLVYLKSIIPDKNINLIIGADCAKNFHLWDKYKEILKIVDLAVFDRPGYTKTALDSVLLRENKVDFYTGKSYDISSTRIKNPNNIYNYQNNSGS